MTLLLLHFLLFHTTLSSVPTAYAAMTGARGPGTESAESVGRLSTARAAFERDLKARLKAAGFQGIPRVIRLVFFKDSRVLEFYAGRSRRDFRFIKSYPVLAASGVPGPKLEEGDLQVPEGLYRIEWLNPNSNFFLSMRVSYPNRDDRRQAAVDGRRKLGGDIMIHGGSASVGCIAIGDEAIAELFHLAAISDFRNWQLVLAPADLRVEPFPADVIERVPWMKEVYEKVKAALLELPVEYPPL